MLIQRYPALRKKGGHACFEGSEAWFHPARTGNRYSSLIVLQDGAP